MIILYINFAAKFSIARISKNIRKQWLFLFSTSGFLRKINDFLDIKIAFDIYYGKNIGTAEVLLLISLFVQSATCQAILEDLLTMRPRDCVTGVSRLSTTVLHTFLRTAITQLKTTSMGFTNHT